MNNDVKELSELTQTEMTEILDNCEDPEFKTEFFTDLLTKIGSYCINSPDLEYDAAGIAPCGTQLGIGFVNNPTYSIFIEVNDMQNGVDIRFHSDESPHAVIKFWMLVGEHIPCAVIVLPDFE